jgi:hypothetical protein
MEEKMRQPEHYAGLDCYQGVHALVGIKEP